MYAIGEVDSTVLNIWTGPFASEYVGHAIVNGDGWDITIGGETFPTTGPHPRTESNWEDVDSCIRSAIVAHGRSL